MSSLLSAEGLPVRAGLPVGYDVTDGGRPTLHALVAYFLPLFGLLSKPRVMPLEDAVDFHRAGFIVLVDPADESDLVRHEQIVRSHTHKRYER